MNSNRSWIKRIWPLIVVSLAVVFAIAIATPVLALYISSSDSWRGDYEPGKPSPPELTQPTQTRRIAFLTDSDTSIENLYVQIPDQGYPVYVRAAIVVNWLKLADCTCTQLVCDSHICKDCECEGCKECETCSKGEGLLCVDCEKCEQDDENCADCVAIPACGNCPDCDKKECEDHEESCAGCALCTSHRDEDCDECFDCETYCLDRDECPRCNDDDSDDWDIIFPQPTADGKDPDFALKIGGEKDSIWKKLDNSGFYYHKKAVTSSGSATGGIITLDKNQAPFIEKFERLETAKPSIDVPGLDAKDCILRVEIIVQTVQAIGSTDAIGDPLLDNTAAWKDAWGEGLTEGPDKWPDRGQY